MKPFYEVQAAAKVAAKPLLKELGKGWRVKVHKDGLNGTFRPVLIYKNTMSVWPVNDGYRAQLKGHPNWEVFAKTASAAITEVLCFFQKVSPQLVQHIDEAHITCDELLNSGRAASPFREALRALCGAEPPIFVRGYHSHDYTDDEVEKLQDWCGQRPTRPHWATNLSMIEAAEMIVQEAVDNANIPGEDK